MQEKKLSRAQNPEEVGVSSAVLADMMQHIINEKLNTHSIMVIRHGKVAFEQFRAPYAPWVPHVMFSVSKSVTACAIGFCVAEGLLNVDDPVINHVPELLLKEGDPHISNLTIHHLLNMTSGKETNILADKTKKQWLQDFVHDRFLHPPGEQFCYNNENIYILSVIVKRVSGQCMVDFLMPRLFEPLGVPRPFWENDGYDIEAGGWGLYLTTESMAKFILCYTQGGIFEGKQVIPAEWVAACSAVQAQRDEDPDDPHGDQGYGYCFWHNVVPNSYRADGVFSQFGLIFPEYDACVVTTGGEIFSRKSLNALFEYLPALFIENGGKQTGIKSVEVPQLPAYPVLREGARCPGLEEHLEDRFIMFPAAAQQITKAAGFPVSVMPMAVFFMSADKAGNINKVRFRFGDDTLKFSWSEGPERNTVLCGMDGQARLCQITLGGIDFIVSCSAAWEGSQKLHVWIRPLNSVAERRLVFTFHGRRVSMLPRSSPSIRSMTDYAAPHAMQMIPNPALARMVSGAMDKIVLVMEPIHIGYLQR